MFIKLAVIKLKYNVHHNNDFKLNIFLKRMRLNEAFRKREKAEKTIEECEKAIYKEARPLILSVLEIIQDRHDWPGKTPEEVTERIGLIYNSRFTIDDIRGVMLEMAEREELEHVWSEDGYRIPPFAKKIKIIPYKKRSF